jgi:ribosomal protein L37AE/L43A
MKQVIRIRRRDGVTQRYRIGRIRRQEYGEKGYVIIGTRKDPVRCPYCGKNVPEVVSIGKKGPYMWSCKKCNERTRKMANLRADELEQINKTRDEIKRMAAKESTNRFQELALKTQEATMTQLGFPLNKKTDKYEPDNYQGIIKDPWNLDKKTSKHRMAALNLSEKEKIERELDKINLTRLANVDDDEILGGMEQRDTAAKNILKDIGFTFKRDKIGQAELKPIPGEGRFKKTYTRRRID